MPLEETKIDVEAITKSSLRSKLRWKIAMLCFVGTFFLTVVPYSLILVNNLLFSSAISYPQALLFIFMSLVSFNSRRLFFKPRVK